MWLTDLYVYKNKNAYYLCFCFRHFYQDIWCGVIRELGCNTLDELLECHGVPSAYATQFRKELKALNKRIPYDLFWDKVIDYERRYGNV